MNSDKLKINLFSYYDNFTLYQKPKYIEWVKDGSGEITFYSDDFIFDNTDPNNCALMIEPRSIPTFRNPSLDRFQYIESHYKNFKYIFTHDSRLLELLPNAKLIYWGGVWDSLQSYHKSKKTKNISFCCSNKQLCQEHIDRLNLTKELKGLVDCMGTYDGGLPVTTKDIYGPYRFSVVVENYKDKYWFTEKICNAFAYKCIPIYWGADVVNELFNRGGIITVDKLENMKAIVETVRDVGPKVLYDSLYNSSIKSNYSRVKKYSCFEDTFWEMHKELLEELRNESGKR